jgi:hypothetical protein
MMPSGSPDSRVQYETEKKGEEDVSFRPVLLLFKMFVMKKFAVVEYRRSKNV